MPDAGVLLSIIITERADPTARFGYQLTVLSTVKVGHSDPAM
jgi:hypothetical protein